MIIACETNVAKEVEIVSLSKNCFISRFDLRSSKAMNQLFAALIKVREFSLQLNYSDDIAGDLQLVVFG